MTNVYQATEKARRAKELNESLGRQESATKTQNDPRQNLKEPPMTQLVSRSGHHLSLKQALLIEFQSRPTTRLAPDGSERTRMDFVEELLPEASCEPDHLAGESEVEIILDDKTPLSTSTERPAREFLLKWVGYDEPTWGPDSNLSCGGLLYDYLLRKRSEQRRQMVQVADEA
ncbi:unnamed protein product [Phytophthora fragariaefolia]|uniref:Unnamed protein product n=1 Tax=Phytophthora fragariaefolia TaxID=1490495 RepID=A0A9W6TV33_9STRA|nr:unnamed protein product [Phytophthora fragariaefolia]